MGQASLIVQSRQDSFVSKQPWALPSLQDELWKAVQDHPTLAMSEAPSWGKESSASHQWGGCSSSSLFSPGFYLAGDNTNSHFQAAEVNGSAGKSILFKTWQRVKQGSRQHGAWRRQAALNMWYSPVCRRWATTPWTPGAPGLCQVMQVHFSWKPKCRLSAVLTRVLYATSGSVLPTIIIFMDHFPSLDKSTISSISVKCFLIPRHAITNFWR